MLITKIGFATGIWEGFFEYDSGRKGETSMDVTMIAGVVAGYGSDSVRLIIFSLSPLLHGINN